MIAIEDAKCLFAEFRHSAFLVELLIDLDELRLREFAFGTITLESERGVSRWTARSDSLGSHRARRRSARV